MIKTPNFLEYLLSQTTTPTEERFVLIFKTPKHTGGWHVQGFRENNPVRAAQLLRNAIRLWGNTVTVSLRENRREAKSWRILESGELECYFENTSPVSQAA